MDAYHPNRKKDAQNPYTLTIEKGIKYISFTDNQGVFHKLESSDELFSLFDSFELEDISFLNEISRHYEQSELTEQSLNERSFYLQEPLEDAVFRKLQNEQLHTAIRQLPENQKRRLLLYYFCGQTYEQIAKSEGCTIMPIKRSIDKAIRKLYAMLK